MTSNPTFPRAGRLLAAGLMLALVLTAGPRAGHAATVADYGPGTSKRQHLHHKGLFHGLVAPGCQRHHRIH